MAKGTENSYHGKTLPGAYVLKDYLKGIFEAARQGDAREESYDSTV